MATATELIEDLRSFGPEVRRVDYRGIGKFSATEIERHFGTFTAFKDAAFPKEVYDTSEPETNEFNGNTWNVTLPKTRIHTLPELLEYCQVDLGIWQVERFIVNRWEMGAKNAAGHVEVTPLYQIKATLIKKQNIVDARVEIESLKQEAKQSAPTPKIIVHSTRKTGNMLEISLCDLHIGKMAWGKETGGPNYDTKIAERTALESLETLIDRTKGYEFDAVTFVIGNDLLQADDLEGRTTKGTYVDTDARYQKNFLTARKLVVTCIERLRQLAPVVVKIVPGNHDEQTAWCIGDSVECYFNRYSDVTVDNVPTLRKYLKWGNVMLLWVHGDRGKRADLPLLMATEQPQMFGETRWREIHTGHLHQTKTEEWHGVRVRILPSLSSIDAWHSAMGFTGQLRNSEAFVWNEKEGLVAQFYFNADR